MAASDVSDLLLRIDATTEGLRRELKKAEDSVGKSSTGMTTNVQNLEKKFQSLSKAIGTGIKIGAGVFAGAAAVVIRNTIAQEKSIAQLEATLRSTGRYTPELSAQMQAYAAELQGVTTYGDEAIIASQGLLLTFTQLGGEQFPRAQKAILDVATAMGQDLQSATLQVGKALNDPILGLTALQRSGIQFSETQKQMIKDMVEVGDVAGAQSMILAELETQFGGSAEAARNTLGGALQGLKNAFGDLLEGDSSGAGVKGATESINDLTATLSSPEAKQAFASFTEMLVGSIQWIVETTNVIGFLTDETKAFFGVIADNDIPRLEDKIANLNRAMEINAKSMFPWVRDRNIELAKEVAALELRLEAARQGFVSSGDAAGTAGEQVGDLMTSTGELSEETEQLTKEYKEFLKAIQDVRDEMYPHRAAATEVMETYRLLRRAVDDARFSQEELDRWMQNNAFGMFNDRLKATNKSFAASHDLLDTHIEKLKKAEAEADPFAKAWETAMERIDTAFADAWKGAFDSFSDFADGLKNAFKQLLAEMAHMAITKPILVSLGLGVPGTALAGGGSGAGGIGSLASIGSALKGGFSGIGSSLAGAGSSLMTGVGHGAGFLANMGIPGMNELAISAYQQGMTMTAGMALTGAAAGLAGGYLGTQLGSSVFGKNANSSVGSTIGGIGGFALGGPVGAFIGAGLGGMLDSAFGSEGNRRAGVGINTGTGLVEGFGEGRNRAPMEELGQQLQAFSQAIGGSGSMLELALGNKSGFQLNGKEFANAAELVDAALDDILDTAWHLAPVVKDLAKAFDGSLEATAAYAQSMQSLWQQAHQNPVQMAIRDFEAASVSATQAYQNQIGAISTLIANFDGSAGAANNLNAALTQNQQFAYQLAIAIQQVSGQLDGMFTSSAQAIRESVMKPADKIDLWKKQRRDIFQSFNTMDDVDEINAAAKEFDRLNNLIFQNISPSAQVGQADAFANYAEKANDVVQGRLDAVLKDIETTQARQNADIKTAMLDAATTQQTAADTMLAAAVAMSAAIAGFNQGSGGFEVNV